MFHAIFSHLWRFYFTDDMQGLAHTTDVLFWRPREFQISSLLKNKLKSSIYANDYEY